MIHRHSGFDIRNVAAIAFCLIVSLGACEVQPGRDHSPVLGASFVFSPSSPVTNQAVQFTDTSTGSPSSWQWNFGDGATSTSRNPSHSFATAASYRVTLVVNNNSTSDSASRNVVVSASPGIRFAVAADMRNYTGDDPDYFRGACEAISASGPVDFLICPGDIDPPGRVNYTIMNYVLPETVWYPSVGNHDAETPADMAWLRGFNVGGSTLPNIVNAGPDGAIETCYSFNYVQTHFIVLNEYYDGWSDTGSDGDIGDALHAWLVNDLAANGKPLVFVIGHEPAYPLPDEESGRLRHQNDSLNLHADNRDRFWKTLAEYDVTAYICGHTHNYSAALFDGVWQIDVGHARGTGDTGARSTFIIISVEDSVVMDVHRLDPSTGQYVPTTKVNIRPLR